MVIGGRGARAWLVAAAVVLLAGCGGDKSGAGRDGTAAKAPAGGNAAKDATPKLVVIGVDSADWRLLDPMMAEGRLPHLKAFRAQAASGRMQSFYPLEKSPLLWASICTGVMPAVHGVDSFVKGSGQKP
jgi:hypothetical protein